MVGEFIAWVFVAIGLGISAGIVWFRLYRRRQSKTWLLPEVKER